ncbi:MAG: HDOD domain-containing protein [Verrucomicrobia bacterium]|nr:HDOD domain-containing protein [Verrucomicrobiota bacterium]
METGDEETTVNDPALVSATNVAEPGAEEGGNTEALLTAPDRAEPSDEQSPETPVGVIVPLATLASTCKLSPAEVEQRAMTVGQQMPDWRQVEWEMQNLKTIPVLGQMARRFIATMDRDDVVIDDVVASIAHDPALCVGVLRLANSVFIGSREPIVELPAAVQVIGVRRVRQMAGTLQLFKDSTRLGGGLEWKHLWQHALATQLLAERLNEASAQRAKPGLAACAILHDVGKIALASLRPEEYKEVLLGAWQARLSLASLEQARLGMDHCEAGWIFGAEAGLPALILDSIAYHDAPDRAHPDHRSTVALVALANQLAKQHGLGFSGDGLCPEMEIWQSPEWKYWKNSLNGTLETEEFAAKEAGWIYEVRRELQIYGG